MADIITTLHPEGTPEDDLYPNIKKENLPSTLQPVADFALSEYEKTLNLINGIFTNGQAYSGTGNTYSDENAKCILLKIEPNTKYALNNGGYTWIDEYNSARDFLRQKPASGTFTTSSDCVYVGLTYPIAVNAMLNYGSTALPYQPYNGKVMHAIDVEGVKLWENGNPNSTMGTATLSVSDVSPYKKLRIELKYIHDSEATFFVDVGVKLNATIRLSCIQGDYAGGAYNIYPRTRDMFINSNTEIYFDTSFTQGDSSASWLVPIAIYGIK